MELQDRGFLTEDFGRMVNVAGSSFFAVCVEPLGMSQVFWTGLRLCSNTARDPRLYDLYVGRSASAELHRPVPIDPCKTIPFPRTDMGRSS